MLFWSRVSASLLRARGLPLDAYSRNSERLGSRYRFAGRTSSAKESRQETDCLVFFIWRKYPPDLLCRRQLKIQQIKPLGYGLKVRSSGAVARAQPLGVSTIRTKGSLGHSTLRTQRLSALNKTYLSTGRLEFGPCRHSVPNVLYVPDVPLLCPRDH